MPARSVLLVAALAAVAVPAWAAARVSLAVDAQASEVGFVAHTSLFDAEGQFSRFDLDASVDPDDLTTARVVARVETASVDSGIDLRDKHLVGEDFFAASRFPVATLRSESVSRDEAGQLWMQATLTLRDKTLPVRFPLNIEGDVRGDGLVASGSFVVNRRDFGVNFEGGVLLPTIRDEVDVFFRVGLRSTQQRSIVSALTSSTPR
jgi:polyisoprenoid-binding protein YceI